MLREKIGFNREWKFKLGDHSGAEVVSYDDSGWETIGLPHSFSIPYFLSDQFYTGYGWYRKTFDLPENWDGKRVFIEFEGVFLVAELFANGLPAGTHKGGYTGFCFDLTDKLKPGRNEIAVRVNNLWNPRLSPRAGEHTFSGGIYRNVFLFAVNPVHVAWYGTFITTDGNRVRIETELENSSGDSDGLTLETVVFDSGGAEAARVKSKAEAGKNLQELDVKNPSLWSPETPVLYRAATKLFRGAEQIDEYETEFGFRTLEWSADRGFFLNGKHRYFHGANLHQDRAGWGDAGTEAGIERDLKLMKECGFDCIRGSHYPHSPCFAGLCDKFGLLFWSENNFWASGGRGYPWWDTAYGYPENSDDAPEFESHVKQCLTEMIRINRNHPSIFVWSMCNEPFFNRVDRLPEVRRFLKELVALAHELDPSRKAAIGGCQRAEMDHLGDIAGYNGDGARLYSDPGIPNVVSEYGSTIAVRPGEYNAGWDEKSLVHPPPAWRSGEILWCGIDHGSRSGKFGWMGAVDYFRLPKRQWYWYRANYAGVPPPEWSIEGEPYALELTADRTTIGIDGRDDAWLQVKVVDRSGRHLSNSPSVTLKIESGPGEFPTGDTITFTPDGDIAIRDGLCAIEMRAYYAGKTVIRATSPGLPDALLEIESEGEFPFEEGRSPVVRNRPYVRFTEKRATDILPLVNQTVMKPTLVSSEQPGFEGNHVVESLEQHSWRPEKTDPHPWIQVDLERILTPEQIGCSSTPADAAHIIEVSEDGTAWKPFVKGDSCRLIRLTFAAPVEVWSVWALAR